MEALIRELRSRNYYREELKDRDLSEALNIGSGSPRPVLSALHVLVNALQHNVAEFGTVLHEQWYAVPPSYCHSFFAVVPYHCRSGKRNKSSSGTAVGLFTFSGTPQWYAVVPQWYRTQWLGQKIALTGNRTCDLTHWCVQPNPLTHAGITQLCLLCLSYQLFFPLNADITTFRHVM